MAQGGISGMTQAHAMLGPKPGTVAHSMVQALYNYGALSRSEMMGKRGLVDVGADTMEDAIKRGVRSGWIERTGKYTYALTDVFRAVMEDQAEIAAPKYQGEVVQPPYRPEFKPYQPKPHPRSDELRRVSFVTCSYAPSVIW